MGLNENRPTRRRTFIAMASTLMVLNALNVSALAEDMSWPGESSNSTPAKPAAIQQNTSERNVELKSETAEESAIGTASQLRKAAPAAKVQAKPQTTKLFGRIDQIAGEANVEMPVLKMETAQMDAPRRVAPLKAAATESKFSGSVATSFPMDFSGTWGGTIRVWRYSVSPLSYEVDAAESNKLRQILSPGTAGDVNFVFQQEYGKIDLQPASVRIMIPASQSYSYEKMMQGGAAEMGGMGGMVSQMMANMKVPVILHFGEVSTRNSMEVGVSGNQIDQRVVKNEIRQLASDVVEEQIVTKNEAVQSSGRAEDGYTESVLRFTRQSPTQLYVLAASVDYDRSGKFLKKLIMYGTVVRGQVMNTSPYPTGMGNLTQVLQEGEGGGANGGGMAGLSSILNSLGAASGGASNYSSSMQNYANNPAVREYLNGAGGGNGSHMEGFSQLMNSLNMLNR